MATKVVGKLDDWGDADLGSSDFMQLEEGSNEVRVFTKPYQFYVVWTEDASGKKRKFRSAGENCPLVERGEEAKPRWFVGVLNRKIGKPSILEVGPQIYRGILTLKDKDAWGDPRKYDLDIERKPKNSQPLYVVSPLPHSAITAEEKKLISEFMDRVDLVKMTEAPTPAEVREMLGISEPTGESSVDDNFNDFESKSVSEEDDDFNFDD